jgi:hypothetical protein
VFPPRRFRFGKQLGRLSPLTYSTSCPLVHSGQSLTALFFLFFTREIASKGHGFSRLSLLKAMASLWLEVVSLLTLELLSLGRRIMMGGKGD